MTMGITMGKPTIEEAMTAIATLTERVASLEAAVGAKARGPKADRAMTDADAYRVKFGDLKDSNHKEAAATTGLSYGQVFSCRGGYTFKHVRADWKPDTEGAK